MTSDREVLRGQLELLDRAPRVTAIALWGILGDEEDGFLFGPVNLAEAADSYRKSLLCSKQLAASELKRELVSLATHAEKLMRGLTKLPPYNLGNESVYNDHPFIEWCSTVTIEESGTAMGNPGVESRSLQLLARHLRGWAAEVEISWVGPVKRPIRPPAGWTNESALAYWVATACREHNRPIRHAISITREILTWASHSCGTRTRPFGKKAWDLVEGALEN